MAKIYLRDVLKKIQLDESSINKNLENLIKNNEEVKEYKISEIEIPLE